MRGCVLFCLLLCSVYGAQLRAERLVAVCVWRLRCLCAVLLVKLCGRGDTSSCLLLHRLAIRIQI